MCVCLKWNCCHFHPTREFGPHRLTAMISTSGSNPLWFIWVYKNQHVFFVRTNLTSHWISISTLQALSKCHHPSWIGQSFSNPTASWISARTSPTIRATACLQSSSASCDANLAKSLEKAEVLQKSSSWNVRVLYLLGTSNTHTSSQIVSQNSNGVYCFN